MIRFYKDVFELIIEACRDKEGVFQNNISHGHINEESSITYINKELVVYVLERIRPFYVSVGDIVFKVSSVILMFASVTTFLTVYNTKISDVLESTTAVITSALPSLIQSQLTLERPQKSIIKYIIKGYEDTKPNKTNRSLQSDNQSDIRTEQDTSGPIANLSKIESDEKTDISEVVCELNEQTGPMNTSFQSSIAKGADSPTEHTGTSNV
ncbi:unnamed protein product [Mytilus edulis]|nr:unnamed protein product [Mytilus edulis]